ncbi:MAG: radical SAM protein [Elusimicrobia bacterium]|nr:radical SAM protein [Elusimicrobiota bacterium]
MAGAKAAVFREKLTGYLRAQLSRLEAAHGRDSAEYRALALQYAKSPLEDRHAGRGERERHYESEVHIHYDGKPLRGVERLYRRTILIEPTTVCAAHCRWCLRGQYPLFSLSEDDIVRAARYCGSAPVRDDLREILITGGDPLMVPQRLEFIFTQLRAHAPNILIYRIGTRVPVQDPERVSKDLLGILRAAAPAKIEIGTQVNHPSELTPEARQAYAALYEVAFKIYDQTVLLKGVNDSVDVLSRLYDDFRYMGIEAHYLFHCIPMKGMAHHRTSVRRGLELMQDLTSSGAFSGRAKPMYTVMTDIGKVSLYHGVILERNEDDEVLLQTRYRVEDFKRRNPSWKAPASAQPDKDGTLRVWYPDGADDGPAEAAHEKR